jgi:hypothetical protein
MLIDALGPGWRPTRTWPSTSTRWSPRCSADRSDRRRSRRSASPAPTTESGRRFVDVMGTLNCRRRRGRRVRLVVAGRTLLPPSRREDPRRSASTVVGAGGRPTAPASWFGPVGLSSARRPAWSAGVLARGGPPSSPPCSPWVDLVLTGAPTSTDWPTARTALAHLERDRRLAVVAAPDVVRRHRHRGRRLSAHQHAGHRRCTAGTGRAAGRAWCAPCGHGRHVTSVPYARPEGGLATAFAVVVWPPRRASPRRAAVGAGDGGGDCRAGDRRLAAAAVVALARQRLGGHR